MESIRILGASQNNLKNVDLDVPVNRLTVITGVSGSGKSSLAFDTLYAEGQRRYVESMSAYARQFLERIQKPHVREIVGIMPAIAIRQKNTTRNPRSTVGTVTEIYDYLRLLYARVGTLICRSCGREVKRDTVDQACEALLNLPEGTRLHIGFPFRDSRLDLNAGLAEKQAPLSKVNENLLRQGFFRLIPGGAPNTDMVELPGKFPASPDDLERAQVLVDRVVIRGDVRERITDSLEICYREGSGVAEVTVLEDGGTGRTLRFTERFECQYCNLAYRSPEPRLFSFNNPYGACPTCQGFGNTISVDPQQVIPDRGKSLREGPVDPFTKPRYGRFQKKLESFARHNKIPMDVPFEELPDEWRRKIWTGDGEFPGVLGFFRYLEGKKYKMHVRIFISRYRGYSRCPDCGGERLCAEARDVYLGGLRISRLTSLAISDLRDFFDRLHLTPSGRETADRILREIRQRLDFLSKVGLEYLTLDRLTSTLSGGEMQRIQLAASLSSSLVGTLYVLDEPSIGLHPRDEIRLIEILKELRDQGNTIVVVEHEREMIVSADHVVDMGPGAGELGGEVVHSGNLKSLRSNPDSLTGLYLSGTRKIPVPAFRRSPNARRLTIRAAREHNLKDLTVRIPLGLLVCVTGVSGSGKSTLVQDILYSGLRRLRGDGKSPEVEVEGIDGWEQIDEVMLVDQSPIGKTPRSNPVTYIKAFDEIRRIFASLRESHAGNLSAGSFSFNLPGGRCEACQGSGVVTVDMQFLADVELVCEECEGRRYGRKILDVAYRGKNIAEVLELTANEALDFFRGRTGLVRKLRVLQEVGLGYLRLGQPATTLSGGEAQRIKLASFLVRPTSGRPMFLFDEPTTGLHFDDIGKLLGAFERLLSQGATVVVIEHNLDVVKCADWIVDLGPEGGAGGGNLVAEGPPEKIAEVPESHTGRFLRRALASDRAGQPQAS